MADDAGKTEPAAPDSPAPTEARRSRMPKLPRFFIIATLFTLALWISWNLRLKFTPGPDDAPVQKHPTKEPSVDQDSPAEILARVDQALRQMRHGDALRYLGELRDAGSLDNPLVRYRLAVCQEANGLVDKAIASYRRAIDHARDPLRFACHLGLSRCLLRQNQPAEARRLLYPFLFDETRQTGASDEFVAEASYLVALALARDHAAEDAFGLDTAVSSKITPLDTLVYLEEVTEPAPRKEAGALPPRLEVREATEDEPTVLQCVRQTDQPAAALLDRLASEGGLKPLWTAEAQRALVDRTLTLHLHNWELADALETAADHFGLVCLIDAPIARFMTQAQAEGRRAEECRRALTQRALQAAVHTDANHVHAPAALLELGNLHAVESRWHDAAYWYNRIIRDTRSSPHLTSAYYNLARVRRQSLEPALARKAFYRVIDHAPGHELALRASIQIAQLHLTEDDVRQAILQLQRADAMAVHSPYQPLATLTLAAAYLHANEPQSARKVLGRARTVLEQTPYRSTAAFLDCYALYRHGKQTKDSKVSASDLIETLLRTKDQTILGAHGRWLLAQAYFELGFWDQAETQARRALAEASAPFQPCVEYTLGLTLVQKNQRTAAEQIFMRWSQQENPYRARASYQLARLHLDERRFRECIEVCQILWKERGLNDDAALLRVWGAALEGTGELAKAAQCYSGKAPE